MSNVDSTKHVADAVILPSGLLGVASHYMEIFNQFLTFLVLMTSLVWGVYRIMDIRAARKKREP